MIKELTPVAVCSCCKGTGTDYSLKHHALVECLLCEGRGWIVTKACLGCGRPAFKFWPAHQIPLIQFCGLEECFTKLVKIHRPNKLAGFVRTGGYHPVAIIDAVKALTRRATHRHDDMEDLKDQLRACAL
jgi:hypothetical protein